MFYKIIYNHIVIDILSDPMWVVWSRNNMFFVPSDITTANGVVASNHNDVYHISGTPEFVGRDEESKTVDVQRIHEAEYLSLKFQLVENAVNEDGTKMSLHELIESKVAEMSAACENEITKGFDIVLSDGVQHHFSLQLPDQLKITKLNDRAVSGETFLPYHADNEPCKIFNADDIIVINKTMEHIVEYQVTYFNSLKMYIRGMTNKDDVLAVEYGIEIPEGYQSDVMKLFVAQQSAGEQ